jgi:hypothetical protein
VRSEYAHTGAARPPRARPAGEVPVCRRGRTLAQPRRRSAAVVRAAHRHPWHPTGPFAPGSVFVAHHDSPADPAPVPAALRRAGVTLVASATAGPWRVPVPVPVLGRALASGGHIPSTAGPRTRRTRSTPRHGRCGRAVMCSSTPRAACRRAGTPPARRPCRSAPARRGCRRRRIAGLSAVIAAGGGAAVVVPVGRAGARAAGVRFVRRAVRGRTDRAGAAAAVPRPHRPSRAPAVRDARRYGGGPLSRQRRLAAGDPGRGRAARDGRHMPWMP